MTIPIKPLEYKVLVEVEKVDAMTKGGIWLPETSQDQQQRARENGKVVAVGSMAFQDPVWPERPEVGDAVLYNRYAGSVILHQGKEYRLINDKDIGAIVTQEYIEEIK